MKHILFVLTFIALSYILFVMGVPLVERTIGSSVMMFALSDRSSW